MKAFDIWDAPMFDAWMKVTLLYGPFTDENGQKYNLTFAAPRTAEETVYPYISKKLVSNARENVEKFYSEPVNQIKWSPYAAFGCNQDNDKRRNVFDMYELFKFRKNRYQYAWYF